MKGKKALRLLPLIGVLVALVALLAVACEGGEEEEATPTPAATEAPAVAKPGDAGIPSNPREVPGLEGVLTLDDGIAMWAERPADEDRTGVTEDTVRIGMCSALTGPVSGLFLPAVDVIKEIVNLVNQAGGIHGRQIDLVIRDDAYDPSTAVQCYKELVESDQVFAIVAGSGTATSKATIDYVVEQGVPRLVLSSGESSFAEPTRKLVFMGNQLPVLLEGRALGEYIASHDPNAKIAVIFQNDSFGQEMLTGLRYAVDQAGAGEIVAEISYEIGTADPTPLMQQAVDAGATHLAIFTNIPAAQIIKSLREVAGSDIPVYVHSAAVTIRGIMQAAGSENFDGATGVTPFVPRSNPNSAKWLALLEEKGLNTGISWESQVFDWEVILRALELAGPDLTREGIVEALETGFDGSWTCSVCLGPIIYGPQDHWALETLQFAKWSDADQDFVRIGDPVSYETSEGNGIRGNIPGFECQPGTCPWREQ